MRLTGIKPFLTPTTKALLIIVLLKFLFFYGFLKGFLYPRYLKPKYESEQHHSEEVFKDLLHNSSQNKTSTSNGTN